jgi:hypothetical protein
MSENKIRSPEFKSFDGIALACQTARRKKRNIEAVK